MAGSVAALLVAMSLVMTNGKKLRFRTIVINLDRRADRLKRFDTEFRNGPASEMVPSLCRLSAVDGSSSEDMSALVHRGLVSEGLVRGAEQGTAYGGDAKINPGTIGCYASHWEAMRLIAEDESVDFGVIAEDDLVKYSPVFWPQFSKLWDDSDGSASKLWQDAGFIYMACNGPCDGIDLQQQGLTKTTLVDAGWPKGTSLYAISRTAAQYLVGSRAANSDGCMSPMSTALDSFLPGSCPGIRYLRFDPPIACPLLSFEPGGDTDIQTVHLVEGNTSLIPHCNGPLETSAADNAGVFQRSVKELRRSYKTDSFLGSRIRDTN